MQGGGDSKVQPEDLADKNGANKADSSQDEAVLKEGQ
jgi:hypothetical protein